jgi:hypothetical protein
MIAALYVHPGGPYSNVTGVDPWDEARDARLYNGPHPVVAHPPCQRWGRYARGGPAAREKQLIGDDGGCFAAALHAVRTWGGVLEHPEGSHAWGAHGLAKPPRWGGWVWADHVGGWTCCVYQGHYGHRAQKATWLYAHGVQLPELVWGKSPREPLPEGLSEEQRRRAIKTGICQRLSKNQRLKTPDAFRDLLIGMARSAARMERTA